MEFIGFHRKLWSHPGRGSPFGLIAAVRVCAVPIGLSVGGLSAGVSKIDLVTLSRRRLL